MSESVERRIIEMLGYPELSPYGNPSPPGSVELGESDAGGSVTGRRTF